MKSWLRVAFEYIFRYVCCRRLRRLVLYGLLIFVTLSTLFMYRSGVKNVNHVSQAIVALAYRGTKKVIQQVCVHPMLKLNDTVIMRNFHPVPPVLCDADPDWLIVDNGYVFVSEFSKQKYGDIRCKIAYILRDGDFETLFTETFELNSTGKLQLKHDFFTCSCKSKNHSYENIHAGITYRPDIHKRSNDVTSGLGLDVLMLGFDSLSHMAYIRKLKKTFDYFTNTLGGIVLNGYNIVGDGTPQALIPILTGKTEIELPRTLHQVFFKTYVDVYPMIWKDFRTKGYVTAFAEDSPQLGTFTYRMNGFKEQPTDHYMRPFMMVARDQYHSKFKDLCLGSKRRSAVFFDWVKKIYEMYSAKPKFVFSFHGEISHDDNNFAETGDDDLQLTMKYLNERGYLNKTLLILMSDHGARFSEHRSSLQGKQEERRPFFGFAFPKWFEQKYPNIIKNLKTNVNRLSSPFDLYPTFKDVLEYDGNSVADTKERGISLFKEIPMSRTCADAGIDLHWCACMDWYPIDKNNVFVKKAVKSLLDHLNNLTKLHRSLCAELNVKAVIEALSLQPQEELLIFKKSFDMHGRIPDFSDNTIVDEMKFQVQIHTTPGNGLFEATLTYASTSDNFHVDTKDISRINKYGDDPKCIERSHEELRKFCYCKSNY